MTVLSERERVQAGAFLAKPDRDAEANAVIEEIAELSGVPAVAIRGRGRSQPVADARAVVMYVLRTRGWHLQEIGDALTRDASTVHTAVTRVRRSGALVRFAKQVPQ